MSHPVMTAKARLRVIAVAAAAVALSACSSSGDDKSAGSSSTLPGAEDSACVAAMQNYSMAVETIPDVDEQPFQTSALISCTREEWLKAAEPHIAASGETKELSDFAVGDPEKVLESMCKGRKPAPKACD
jgi:hypothetical protein